MKHQLRIYTVRQDNMIENSMQTETVMCDTWEVQWDNIETDHKEIQMDDNNDLSKAMSLNRWSLEIKHNLTFTLNILIHL